MKEYRRFTKTDWDAFAGAEKFNEKSEPFIYEKEMNDGLVGLTLIADRTGIELMMTCEEDGTVCYDYNKSLTSIQAEGEMRAIIKELEKYTYAPDLAYCLDHSYGLEDSNPLKIFNYENRQEY